jgi:hypothetical protein
LAKELGPLGAGVIVTQVVPFPGDASIPIVARYQAAMQAVDPDSKPSFGSLEGYMVGRLVSIGLEKLPGEPTRQSLLDTILNGSFDLGGVNLVYGKNDNQGMDNVFLTVIQPDGTLKAVSTLKQLGG